MSDSPAAAAGGDRGGGEAMTPEKKKMMVRLPQAEVDWILAQERERACDPEDFVGLRTINRRESVMAEEEIEETRAILLAAAALCAAASDAFAEYQAEVRAAVESRGYFEVDGDYLAVRARRQARLEEDWAELFADFELSDCEEDNQEEEEEDPGIRLKPTVDEHRL
uniref:Uncharacterized protein n=1 Tax=Oryza glumipatula TaxID=40148 RepID=A0A0E0BL15_9ORYZ